MRNKLLSTVAKNNRWAIKLLLCLLFISPLPSYSTDIQSLISLDQNCLNFVTGGWCPYTDKLIITHNIPVAFVEVVKSPGEPFFAPVAASAEFATRTYRNGDEFGFDVTVYDVSELAHKVLGACALCDPNSQTTVSPGSNPISGLSNLTDSLDSLAGSLDKAVDLCAGTSESINKIFQLSANKPGLIKLVYDSTVDSVHWRTGCRDQAKASNIALHMQCAGSSFTSTFDHFTGSDMTSSLGLSNKNCVGTWGAVYPRQYRSFGTEIQAAAFTAWRALHLARNNIKSLKHEVITSNQLQHAWPMVSTCFKPGAPALLVERDTVASLNGNYAFIYWKKVGCCRGLSDIGSCFNSVGQQQAQPQNLETLLNSSEVPTPQ